jgi:hypothetical protein
MFKERQSNISGGIMGNIAEPEVFAEAVGRHKEIDDYLKMTFDDLRGPE